MTRRKKNGKIKNSLTFSLRLVIFLFKMKHSYTNIINFCVYTKRNLFDSDKLRFCFKFSHAIDTKENRINIVRF